nr:unnamed protein product [Callosobruchus chinensis]
MPPGSRKRRLSWSLSEDRSILKSLKGMEKCIKFLELRSTGLRSSNSGSDEGSIYRSRGDSNYSSPDSDVTTCKCWHSGGASYRYRFTYQNFAGVVREVPAVETVASPLQKPLDANTLMLLEDDVTQKTPLGVSIQPEIAEKWLYIAKHDLEVSVRKSLLEKYLLPENCALVGPPQLNVLVKQAIRESVARRDDRLANIQLRLSADLSAIAKTLSRILEEKGGGKECAKDAIEALNDAGRLLTDVIHSESMLRRELASYTPLDKWLFGDDLEGRLKAAKELQISSRQLKFVKNNTKITVSKSQACLSLTRGEDGQAQNTRSDPQPETSKTGFTSDSVLRQVTVPKEHDQEILPTVTHMKAYTHDRRILSWLQGFRIPIIVPSSQSSIDKRRKWSRQEQAVISDAIHTLTEFGAISKVQPCKGQFISDIFVISKSDGTNRLILNLKKFNEYVETLHFKMEGYKVASELIKPLSWMCKVDLKDAYLMVPVHKQDKKYLRFYFNSILYEYNCLCFGLNCAPMVFTKLLKPIISFLRKKRSYFGGLFGRFFVNGGHL